MNSLEFHMNNLAMDSDESGKHDWIMFMIPNEKFGKVLERHAAVQKRHSSRSSGSEIDETRSSVGVLAWRFHPLGGISIAMRVQFLSSIIIQNAYVKPASRARRREPVCNTLLLIVQKWSSVFRARSQYD